MTYSGAGADVRDVSTWRSLRRRFVAGAFWSLVSAGLVQGFALLGAIVSARLLGEIAYGEWGIINSTVSMLGVLAGLGLAPTAVKYTAQYRRTNPDEAGRILGLVFWTGSVSASVLIVGLCLAAPLIAKHGLNAPHLVTELRIGCGLLLFNALNGVQTGALGGFEAFKGMARVNMVRGVASVPLVVVGVLLFGVTGLIGANIAVAGLGYWLNARLLRAECAAAHIRIVRPRHMKHHWSTFWNVSFPAFLASVVSAPVAWVANMLLVNQPNGYGEMGIMNAVYQWRTFVMLVPAAVAPAGIPALADLYGRGDARAYRSMLKLNFVTTTGIAVLTALPVALMASRIMSAYGPGFVRGGPALALMAVATALMAVGSVGGNAIGSWGTFWAGLALNSAWAGVFLALSVCLVSYGAVGLSAAYFGSYAVHVILQGAYVIRRLRTEKRRASLALVSGSTGATP